MVLHTASQRVDQQVVGDLRKDKSACVHGGLIPPEMQDQNMASPVELVVQIDDTPKEAFSV